MVPLVPEMAEEFDNALLFLVFLDLLLNFDEVSLETVGCSVSGCSLGKGDGARCRDSLPMMECAWGRWW